MWGCWLELIIRWMVLDYDLDLERSLRAAAFGWLGSQVSGDDGVVDRSLLLEGIPYLGERVTLGLLLYWWHSSRQQAGRGSMPITAIRTMPTLDVTSLSDAQLQVAESIFDDMRYREFLPANEAYRDDSRKELDRRVLVDLLGLPEEKVMDALELLRLKWCSEPSVHGGKGSRP